MFRLLAFLFWIALGIGLLQESSPRAGCFFIFIACTCLIPGADRPPQNRNEEIRRVIPCTFVRNFYPALALIFITGSVLWGLIYLR